jgi:phage shock protein E
MMTDHLAPAPRPRRTLRRLTVALALVATAGLAAGCGATVTATAPTLQLPGGTVLIDVRTPAEFAEGHLEGAINIPVELPTFAAQVAELDPDLEYLVYCRSGRRSAVAIEIMDTLDLRTVDLGSVSQAAAATGLRVVR